MNGVAEVHDAAAVVQDAGKSSAVLVAYVSPAAVDAGTVREACAAKLPHYMVPQMVVALPALPRLANGKVRGATPVGPRSEKYSVAPCCLAPSCTLCGHSTVVTQQG
jgi:AMP-binding enzyme C-terminal domain